MLERQKRFGGVIAGDGNETGVEGLNAALPERSRKRGRQAAGGVDGDGGGKRRDSRRRDGRGEQQQGKNKDKSKGTGGTSGTTKKKVVDGEQVERDRIAAEKRKARFAGGS